MVAAHEGGGGGGAFIKFSVQPMRINWTQSDQRFGENEMSNRYKINEKVAQLDENQGEYLYTMLKICQII